MIVWRNLLYFNTREDQVRIEAPCAAGTLAARGSFAREVPVAGRLT